MKEKEVMVLKGQSDKFGYGVKDYWHIKKYIIERFEVGEAI